MPITYGKVIRTTENIDSYDKVRFIYRMSIIKI